MGLKNPHPCVIVHGCSLGAYHAVNIAMRHPHLFRKLAAFSGRYDLTINIEGFPDLFEGYTAPPPNRTSGRPQRGDPTHFVSCMVLSRKYGEPPVRVVRKSHPEEVRASEVFRYIYVYAKHVDEDELNPKLLAEPRRRAFSRRRRVVFARARTS